VWCVRGFQGGCNYQVGAWVWGVEVDGSATNKADKGFETAAEEEAAGLTHTVQNREKGHPHLMAEVLPQFSGVLHFLSRAVASINLSSSWAVTYSPL
jgi:hypothetical protein